MSPVCKLKQLVIFKATGERIDGEDDIKGRWDELAGSDALLDAKGEVRPGEYRTGLPCGSSRHYEAEAVAARMLDGSYVGWTHWFGGGKHGEPRAVPWIEEAYDLDMEEVQVVQKVFKRRGS